MALLESHAQPDSPAQTASDQAASNRSPRVPASQIGAFIAARLLPGGDVEILNVSNTGLLVEGKNRLVVGAKVSIRIRGAAVKRVDGSILRSRVATIHRDGTLSYESAIEFDKEYPLDQTVNPDAAAADPGDGKDVYVLDADNDW